MDNSISNKDIWTLIDLLFNTKNEILIQKRTIDALFYPNKWGFFGGEIEKNEVPIEAVNGERQ